MLSVEGLIAISIQNTSYHSTKNLIISFKKPEELLYIFYLKMYLLFCRGVKLGFSFSTNKTVYECWKISI